MSAVQNLTPSLATPAGPLPRWATLLWRGSPVLTATGLAMIALALATGAAWLLDPSVVDGRPVWQKPTKFALSIAAYTLTMAWLIGYVRGLPRTKRWLAVLMSAAFVIEMLAVVGQAARGRTSHFNIASFEDSIIFAVMGATIATFYVLNLIVAGLLMRQRDVHEPMRAALRGAMVVSAIGMGLGALALQPNSGQVATAEAGTMPATWGAHSVGDEDHAATGLPVLGWNDSVGDLRIGHFVGMHALQLIPFFGLWISRRRRLSQRQQTRHVYNFTFLYAGMTALVTWQAFRGQALFPPDAITVAALGSLVVLGIIGFFIATSAPPRDAQLHPSAQEN